MTPTDQTTRYAGWGLPHPAYLRTLVQRTAILWILIRLSFLIFSLFIGAEPAVAVQIPTFGLPAVAAWLDRRGWHELLLHANLGTFEGWLWGASIGTSCALDLLAHLLLRSL